MNANTPRNDAIDRNIDCALSALRDAQPRSGLTSRILASLEHRTAEPQSSGFRFSVHIALWTATAAAVLAVASMMIIHHQTAKNGLSKTLQNGSESPKNALILNHQNEPTPPKTSTANLPRTRNTLSFRPQHRGIAADARTPSIAEQAQSNQANSDLDAQALADLHAPSHPAPPLPLTPQEKLFLRMLRYGNATQIAELNPLVRAKLDADETAEFKAFFPDPPPLKQPLGDTE